MATHDGSTFPIPLAEPNVTALRLAMAYLHERYAPVGILVSGTIVRGMAQESSDLDIVAVHVQGWRQRTQRFFNGVPAEMFVNPADRIRESMRSEAVAGRPVMAHMLATGVVLLDSATIMGALQAEARANLAAGPRVSAGGLQFRRYAIATTFEDAVDLREIDEERSQSLLTEALVEAVKWHFLNQGRWLPRSKALLSDLDALDPGLGRMARHSLRNGTLEERLSSARPLVERIIGATGFFEWESDPEERPSSL